MGDGWLVILNPLHDQVRQRATLAEELTDIVMGHPPSAIDAVAGTRTYDDRIEDEAYGVGGAMLLPYSQAKCSAVRARWHSRSSASGPRNMPGLLAQSSDAGRTIGLMPLPPSDSPFGKPIQPELNKALMGIMQLIPALLDAQLEGETGPVTLPPEQLAEALQKALFLFMQYVPIIAGKLDILYAAVADLERRLESSDGGASPTT